jgi:hypothetical protein
MFICCGIINTKLHYDEINLADSDRWQIGNYDFHSIYGQAFVLTIQNYGEETTEITFF